MKRKIKKSRSPLAVSILLSVFALFCFFILRDFSDKQVLSATDICVGTVCIGASASPTPTASCFAKPQCITPANLPPNCTYGIEGCQCVYHCAGPTPTPTVFENACPKPTCEAPSANCYREKSDSACSCGNIVCLVLPTISQYINAAPTTANYLYAPKAQTNGTSAIPPIRNQQNTTQNSEPEPSTPPLEIAALTPIQKASGFNIFTPILALNNFITSLFNKAFFVRLVK